MLLLFCADRALVADALLCPVPETFAEALAAGVAPTLLVGLAEDGVADDIEAIVQIVGVIARLPLDTAMVDLLPVLRPGGGPLLAAAAAPFLTIAIAAGAVPASLPP